MTKRLDSHVITLPQGSIKGLKNESVYGDTFYSFEGIPYAKPPVGALRFKAPQPAEPWTEILDCTQCRSKATQLNRFTRNLEGAEDCLYINVYAKEVQSEKPLPVMVWIYGGGFTIGEATRECYSPDYIMSEDVILVSFNYRLNSLGFLSLKDPALEVPGNAGLKDQVLALKWVKKYISHFNGDPENITVFGESAGGASTHYMALTNQTRGLFQRAIPMSSCALNYWAKMPQTDMAYRLAKFHGYDGENIDKDVLDFLCALDHEKLVSHNLFDESDVRNSYLFSFGPIIEPYVGDDCVIPTDPFEMLKTAWSNTIPMIFGFTSDEGLLMYLRLKAAPELMNAFGSDLERLLVAEVRSNHTEAENIALSEKLRQLHFGNKQPSEETIAEFVDFYSYLLFLHDIMRSVQARLKYATGAPTYLYRFNMQSNVFKPFRDFFYGQETLPGVAHADDLGYLFYCKPAQKLAKETAEYQTIKRMVGLWTSFAKNGNPNCELIKPTTWETVNAKNPYKALNISNEVKFIELPEKTKFEVWNTLYKKENLY